MTRCSQCGNDVAGQETCAQCGVQVHSELTATPRADAAQGPSDAVANDPDAPEIPSLDRAPKICLVEKYCNFQGRASRKEFWSFVLTILFFSLVLLYLARLVLFDSDRQDHCLSISDVLALYLFLPTVGVVVRRLHDVGFSHRPLLFLLGFGLATRVVLGVFDDELDAIFGQLYDDAGPMLPNEIKLTLSLYRFGLALIGMNLALFLGLILLLCWPGTKGPNKYGPAPWKRPNP